MTEEVKAPLSGNIWEVIVKVGESVEEDDELIIIEALKMENPVYAPCDGKIVEIKVTKGDQVEDDDILIIMEPTG